MYTKIKKQVDLANKINEIQMLNEKELDEMLNKILEYEALPEELKVHEDPYDFIVSSRTYLIYELTKIIVSWYFHLYNAVRDEEFERAAKIRDVIKIEKKEFIFNYMGYCIEAEEGDIQMIEEIEQQAREAFKI